MLAIFAHPDDEAFGPSGSMIKWIENNDYIIHLVCVTDGAMGKKHTDGIDLATMRRAELEHSAAVIGIETIYFLHFEDGSLCNNNYHELEKSLENILDQHSPDTILTFEPRGISGHLDHIAVTSVTTKLFNKKSYAKTLLYHVMHADLRKKFNDYFVFMPPGYTSEQIDMTINIEDVWEQKKEAILKHVSQKSDSSRMLGFMHDLPKEEHFLELKKV